MVEIYHVIYFRQSQLLLAKTNEHRTTIRKALLGFKQGWCKRMWKLIRFFIHGIWVAGLWIVSPHSLSEKRTSNVALRSRLFRFIYFCHLKILMFWMRSLNLTLKFYFSPIIFRLFFSIYFFKNFPENINNFFSVLPYSWGHISAPFSVQLKPLIMYRIKFQVGQYSLASC